MASLDYLFTPGAVAIVGASERHGENHHIKSFVRSRQLGKFKGGLYVVNPAIESVLGVKSYARLTDIPGPVDYVIVVYQTLTAAAILNVMKDCAAKRVRAVTVFSSGFAEETQRSGSSRGKELQELLVRLAREGGFRLIGPNCLGLYYYKSGLVTAPNQAEDANTEGGISVVAQSSGAAGILYGLCTDAGLHVGKVASIGNSADLTIEEFLEYYTEDDETKTILAYIESASNGRRFFDAMKNACVKKPVIVLKGGVTAAGVEVAVSHTAALSTGVSLYEVAFKQAGAISAASFEEMADVAQALQASPAIGGSRVAIITNVTTARTIDIAVRNGLDPVPLDAEVSAKLKALALQAGEVNTMTTRSVDLGIAMASVWGQAMELVGSRPYVDVVVLVQSLDAATSSPSEYVRTIAAKRDRLRKPVVIVSHAIFEDRDNALPRAEVGKLLCAAGVPVYPSIDRASRAVALAVGYNSRRRTEITDACS